MPRPAMLVTPAMERVLDVIRSHRAAGQRSTLRAISDAMDWNATSTAADVVDRLKKAKLVRKGKGVGNLIPVEAIP